MTDLHRFLLSGSVPHQLPSQKEQQVHKESREEAEDARALCAHRARTVCIAQGRHHLSQSVAREVQTSGEALRKMPNL